MMLVAYSPAFSCLGMRYPGAIGPEEMDDEGGPDKRSNNLDGSRKHKIAIDNWHNCKDILRSYNQLIIGRLILATISIRAHPP